MSPDPVRILGACGVAASALVFLGGVFESMTAVAASGFVMLAGNIYALGMGGRGCDRTVQKTTKGGAE